MSLASDHYVTHLDFLGSLKKRHATALTPGAEEGTPKKSGWNVFGKLKNALEKPSTRPIHKCSCETAALR